MNNSYKEHIQFLRAIAVIFVFLYHLKIPYFYNYYKNLCSTNKCFSYNSKNNFLMLRDSNHLSVEATESLVPSLKKFVSQNILID